MSFFPLWVEETPEQIMSRLLEKVDSKWDKREGSFVYDTVFPVALERELQRKELKEIWEMSNPKTATGPALDFAIEIRSPLKRNKAEFAKGEVLVKGNPGTPLQKGTLYMSTILYDGQEYFEFIQEDDYVIGDTGQILIPVQAVQAGNKGNIPADTIEIASPVVGVASVTNLESFKMGRDSESDESFRARYFLWLEEAGTSGKSQDYVRWALSVNGVGWARAIDFARGLGTVDVIISGPLNMINELIPLVQKVIDEKKTRGVDVKVVPVKIIQRTFRIKTYGLSKEDSISAALEYLNSIGIGGSYSPGKLIAAIVNAGASNAQIIEPATVFTLPVNGVLDPVVIVDE